MKKVLLLALVGLLSLSITLACAAEKTKGKTGETLFKEHCAVCHPDGGNIINPQMTLQKKSLAEHGITKPKDIINKMRNPGPGMTKFDEKTVPDAEAKKIAKYILNTFK
jgi:cytochrome c6